MLNKLWSPKKAFVVSLIILFVGFSVANWSLLQYGMMQGKGQLHVLWKAKPLSEVLRDPDFPDSLKRKISFIQEVREFAIDSLDLSDSESYKSLFDQKGQDILWNLSASEPYRLKSVTWSFPFLGEFSYKGFFDLEKAKKEERVLKNKGFDTRIRPVNAWSTLGWFDDPILSNQLFRSNGSLAELVIHELTHSTIFIKDSLEFNENLASFIGEQGARRFLRSKYGADSDEMNRYIESEKDYSKFTRHMLIGTDSLESLYGRISSDLDSIKEIQKRMMIRQIVNSLDTISFYNTNRYSQSFNERLPNNAFFIGFRRYFGKVGYFEEQLHTVFDGNLSAFIGFYKENQ